MAVTDEATPAEAGRIFAAFLPRLRSFVSARVRNDPDRDDILQEIYLRVHRHAARVRKRVAMAPWLFRVARSAIADHHRRGRPVSPPGDTPGVTDHGGTESAEVPGEPAMDHPMAACVVPALAALPLADRETTRMAEFEGLGRRDAARRAGVTVTAMKSRVQRARAKLRRALTDCCRLELDGRRRIMGFEPRTRCPYCGPERSPPGDFAAS